MIKKHGLEFQSPMKWMLIVAESLHGILQISKAQKKQLKQMNVIVMLVSSMIQADKPEIAHLHKMFRLQQGFDQVFEIIQVELDKNS